uniref:translation initiation factor IF-2-like n=1 Tax=Callithrix jacchus TaxID=9483 RepID=UPI0023DD2A66|nr:translation initiation factor IF-2-like [Callithrix jacchus]
MGFDGGQQQKTTLFPNRNHWLQCSGILRSFLGDSDKETVNALRYQPFGEALGNVGSVGVAGLYIQHDTDRKMPSPSPPLTVPLSVDSPSQNTYTFITYSDALNFNLASTLFSILAILKPPSSHSPCRNACGGGRLDASPRSPPRVPFQGGSGPARPARRPPRRPSHTCGARDHSRPPPAHRRPPGPPAPAAGFHSGRLRPDGRRVGGGPRRAERARSRRRRRDRAGPAEGKEPVAAAGEGPRAPPPAHAPPAPAPHLTASGSLAAPARKPSRGGGSPAQPSASSQRALPAGLAEAGSPPAPGSSPGGSTPRLSLIRKAAARLGGKGRRLKNNRAALAAARTFPSSGSGPGDGAAEAGAGRGGRGGAGPGPGCTHRRGTSLFAGGAGRSPPEPAGRRGKERPEPSGSLPWDTSCSALGPGRSPHLTGSLPRPPAEVCAGGDTRHPRPAPLRARPGLAAGPGALWVSHVAAPGPPRGPARGRRAAGGRPRLRGAAGRGLRGRSRGRPRVRKGSPGAVCSALLVSAALPGHAGRWTPGTAYRESRLRLKAGTGVRDGEWGGIPGRSRGRQLLLRLRDAPSGPDATCRVPGPRKAAQPEASPSTGQPWEGRTVAAGRGRCLLCTAGGSNRF